MLTIITGDRMIHLIPRERLLGIHMHAPAPGSAQGTVGSLTIIHESGNLNAPDMLTISFGSAEALDQLRLALRSWGEMDHPNNLLLDGSGVPLEPLDPGSPPPTSDDITRITI